MATTACISPLVLLKEYENQRHSHNPESKFKRATNMVPCGKCPNCLRRKAQQWAFRLSAEQSVSHSTHFVTLTYNDYNVPVTDNNKLTLNKRHVQLFIKRLRKHNAKHTNRRIKYYAVGEYGGNTRRPHYHAIIFNMHENTAKALVDIWQNGFVQCGMADQGGAVNYTTNYLQKKDTFINPDYIKVNTETGEIVYEEQREREFSVMSKNLGISWLTPDRKKFYKERLLGVIIKNNGHYTAMPRYYKDKIFTKQEKIKIAEEFAEQFETDYEELVNKIGDRGLYQREHNGKIRVIENAKYLNQIKRQLTL